MKKYIIIIVLLLLAAVIYRLVTFAIESKKRPDTIGLENGRIRKCGSKPNCVSSMDSREKFYIAPLKVSENIKEPQLAFAKLKEVILAIPSYSLESESENYLHFTEKTKLFGFVDDIEFHLGADTGTIDVRSASRVGTSDLGVNRKRVENIRERYSRVSTKE